MENYIILILFGVTIGISVMIILLKAIMAPLLASTRVQNHNGGGGFYNKGGHHNRESGMGGLGFIGLMILGIITIIQYFPAYNKDGPTQANILGASVTRASPQDTDRLNGFNNSQEPVNNEINIKNIPEPPVRDVELEGSFYIQTGAYSLFEGAEKDLTKWEDVLNVSVRIHEEQDQDQETPLYKVLIGPFTTREDAENYQIENDITRSDVKEFLETNFLNIKKRLNHA